MGFNFSGIAISKNYSNDIKGLAETFGWNLVFEKEINFEEASANWKDEGICDIYFSENGTLIFAGMDTVFEKWGIPGANTLTFALSETAMAFNLVYFENNEMKRSIMEAEGERMSDEGEALEIENTSEDTSDLIINLVGEIVGKTFWSIEPDEKCYRYTVQ